MNSKPLARIENSHLVIIIRGSVVQFIDSYVVQTCRFQSRSVMDFFAQVLIATIGIIDRFSLNPSI
jgi:hypothetical protein